MITFCVCVFIYVLIAGIVYPFLDPKIWDANHYPPRVIGCALWPILIPANIGNWLGINIRRYIIK